MSESIDLGSKRVSDADAINEVISARAALAKVKTELAAVTKDRNELLVEYGDLQSARYSASTRAPDTRKESAFIRVICNDVHGSMMDKEAVNAFLADLKNWNPNEVVLNGDIIECGGFLAAHHTLGYVAQTEYSWQQDIAAGNWFLDEVQKAAPNAVIHFIEGNHEDRVERWIVDQTMRHNRDSEFLRALLSPKPLLRLDERTRKLQSHFQQAQKDVEQILTSSEKIARRGGRISALELQQTSEPEPVVERSIESRTGLLKLRVVDED